MKRTHLQNDRRAIGLASSVGVGAEQMSSNEHKLAANKIDVEDKAAKAWL